MHPSNTTLRSVKRCISLTQIFGRYLVKMTVHVTTNRPDQLATMSTDNTSVSSLSVCLSVCQSLLFSSDDQPVNGYPYNEYYAGDYQYDNPETPVKKHNVHYQQQSRKESESSHDDSIRKPSFSSYEDHSSEWSSQQGTAKRRDGQYNDEDEHQVGNRGLKRLSRTRCLRVGRAKLTRSHRIPQLGRLQTSSSRCRLPAASLVQERCDESTN